MALPEVSRTLFEWPDLVFNGFTGRFPFLADQVIKVEDFQEGDTLVVRAELPDIDPDKDVRLIVADGYVELHAERREEKKEEGEEGFRSEFTYGSFTRMIPLPAGATEDDVKKTYKDGILEVRVPFDSTTTETSEAKSS
jgi:HSP20 family protein